MTITFHSLRPHSVTVADAARLEVSLRDLPPAVLEFIIGVLRSNAEGHQVCALSEEAVLTSTQAARVIGVSRPTLIRYLDEGRIPSFRAGRDRRVHARHVLAYIEERDRHAQRLAEARQGSRSVEEQVVAELGLSPEDAQALGLR